MKRKNNVKRKRKVLKQQNQIEDRKDKILAKMCQYTVFNPLLFSAVEQVHQFCAATHVAEWRGDFYINFCFYIMTIMIVMMTMVTTTMTMMIRWVFYQFSPPTPAKARAVFGDLSCFLGGLLSLGGSLLSLVNSG